MKILVTGAAGFIGSGVAKSMLDAGYEVVGLDNINDYYDVNLKYGRLAELGIERDAIKPNEMTRSATYSRFRFIKASLEDSDFISRLFAEEQFGTVVNLAAQAGVRYSIENPACYIQSNLIGFFNILEGCRHNKVKHLIFASSSSVYGLNGKVPYSESDGIAHPVSLYAATKKSNELMAHAYSKLYSIPVTGLRFFTVYGPWGRPDMSPFLFMDAILRDRPIKVFNNGEMWRDFTYIDDVVKEVTALVNHIPQPNSGWDAQRADPSTSSAPYRIYNVGNQHITKLTDYIECIEKAIGRKARKEYLPMQPGDVLRTWADSSAIAATTGIMPGTKLQDGIDRTVAWFRKFYKMQ
ncbi:MAG: NAD-dependent epimerase [Candidatus Amulumruptor caecigallinarius]|nr:NAD-dependent epimerase [Candidatus Amulumruptor caecigallinarius]